MYDNTRMPSDDNTFPECCSYCPHRQDFSANCDHELSQALVAELSSEPDRSCPVFDDWRTEEMLQLEDDLSTLVNQ